LRICDRFISTRHPRATADRTNTGRRLPSGVDSSRSVFERVSAGDAGIGYVDGQSVRIEDRWAGGRADRLPELISDLLTHGVDVFVAGGANAASAIRRAVDKPVVVVGFGDPMTSGLVASPLGPIATKLRLPYLPGSR